MSRGYGGPGGYDDGPFDGYGQPGQQPGQQGGMPNVPPGEIPGRIPGGMPGGLRGGMPGQPGGMPGQPGGRPRPEQGAWDEGYPGPGPARPGTGPHPGMGGGQRGPGGPRGGGQRPATGPMRQQGRPAQGRPGAGGPQARGAGPMRQRPGSRSAREDYPGDRYDGGESWGGDFGESGDSFTGDSYTGESLTGGRGGGFPGRGAPGADNDFGGGAWLGDDYDSGDDGPRGRRGRGGRRGGRGPADDLGFDDDYDSRDSNPVPVKAQGKKRKRGPVRRLAPWIAVIVVLLLIGVPGYWAYGKYMAKYHPADFSGPGTSPTVTVVVPAGASASSIGPMLTSDGVIASSRALVLAAEHSTSTAGLIPGTYKLNTHMQASLAYAALLNPKDRVQLTFTIKEGQRVAQIIAALASQMHVPVSQFESIVNNPPASLGLPSYAVKNVAGAGPHVIGYKLEGFLWPATYSIQPHETPLQVLTSMVAKYNQTVQQENLTAAAKTRGLSLYAVLIEASMVQAEAGNQPQMPKIASVIKNRFNANMPLQFDSVLQYGQNTFSLNIKDAQSSIPGPWNDFLNRTLPPTPISNPGLEAIDAVLHPANTKFIYFLAQPDGSSLFCVNQPSSATATKCPAGG